MSIIVFGANGFIGRNVIHDLSEIEDDIIALSRSFEQEFFIQYPNVQCHTIDFQKPGSYQSYIKAGDTIVHLIYQGIPYMADQDRTNDIETNLIPTVQLAELCLKKGVKRFIFASSGGAIYGNSDQASIDENTPANPINSYGITRLASENYIKSLFSGSSTDYANLRISNPYGRFSKPNSAIGLFNKIEQCLIKHETFKLRVPLNTTRDYVKVSEVSSNIKFLVEIKKTINETFNLSSGVGLTIQDVIDMMEKKHKSKLNIAILISNTPIIRTNILNNHKFKSYQQNYIL